MEIFREIGGRVDEGSSLTGLGEIHKSQGDYQKAIEYHQQSLDIARTTGYIRGQGIAWFNLGETLENINRESDALGAYRNARGLYETMGLDNDVRDCKDAIARLSQAKKLVVFRRRLWRWLQRLWRWVCGWFR